MKRKNEYSTGNPYWTRERILQGIEKFLREYGRHPTALDFDRCPDLPTARQIQRQYGGLRKFRLENNLPVSDYSSGEEAGKKRMVGWKIAVKSEKHLENILCDRFGEPFVHRQKHYGEKQKLRMDFFVYAQNSCFGVDVFCTEDIFYLQRIVNIKEHKYRNYPQRIPLYFVCDSETIKQTDLEQKIVGMIYVPNMKNLKVLTLKKFIKELDRYTPLQTTTDYPKFSL